MALGSVTLIIRAQWQLRVAEFVGRIVGLVVDVLILKQTTNVNHVTLEEGGTLRRTKNGRQCKYCHRLQWGRSNEWTVNKMPKEIQDFETWKRWKYTKRKKDLTRALSKVAKLRDELDALRQSPVALQSSLGSWKWTKKKWKMKKGNGNLQRLMNDYVAEERGKVVQLVRHFPLHSPRSSR